jgi:acetyl-CoA synthetase
VGPAEIEGALITHHTVSEAVAIGVPDEIKGETIVCFAVLKTGVVAEAKLKEMLREHVVEELGKALKPKDILFVSQLPKTRNAKILRRMVKMVYLGNNVEDTSALANPEALEEIERAR